MCFLVLYESKVGVMREDDGLVGVVGESADREGVMKGHVEREIVGDGVCGKGG